MARSLFKSMFRFVFHIQRASRYTTYPQSIGHDFSFLYSRGDKRTSSLPVSKGCTRIPLRILSRFRNPKWGVPPVADSVKPECDYFRITALVIFYKKRIGLFVEVCSGIFVVVACCLFLWFGATVHRQRKRIRTMIVREL